MKHLPKALLPMLMLMLVSCVNSKVDPIALTPASTVTPTSLSAIKAIPCADDVLIERSHLDQITNGTLVQIARHNAQFKAHCGS